MNNRNRQIKYYTNLLKENEILLLKSCDVFFKNHYSSSPLAILTGFLGSEGEAIIDKNGEITIFVDTRYHLLVDNQVFDDIKVYKMALGESFFDAFKKCYKKDTIMHVFSEISLEKYLKLSDYFDLRKYDLKKSFCKNVDFNKNSKIYLIDKTIDKVSFLDKVKKIKEKYPKTKSLLIFNLDEISYLTNLRSFQMEFSSNFRSILYLDLRNSNHVLFADKISSKIKIDGLKFMNLEEFSSFVSTIDDEIGLNIKDVTLKNYLLIKNPKNLKTNSISFLASIKPLSVIQELENCFLKTDIALLNFKKKIKNGMSEYDLSQVFENELLKTGASGLSFKTILAIGENSASIHYSEPSKNKILKDENLILIDCGGYWKSGFATDITRVFYFGVNPKPIYKKIYTNVLKTFLKCFMSSEFDAKKLDNIARKSLKQFEKEGFNFNHGLGHGIGTSVHQNPPVLSMVSMDTITPFQVHSIEPGLYGKTIDNIEFGIRLENCVYADLNYNRISLSKFPFEEVLIDYSLLTVKEKEILKIWQGNFNENI